MSELPSIYIETGNASRFLRKSWITPEPAVTPVAFDLRERTPPETYVSFFLVSGDCLTSQINSAISIIGKRLNLETQDGAIIILGIEECLDSVNDADEPEKIICFKDEKIPHCGLHYLSKDHKKILMAKTTLCFIAKKKLHQIQKKCLSP